MKRQFTKIQPIGFRTTIWLLSGLFVTVMILCVFSVGTSNTFAAGDTPTIGDARAIEPSTSDKKFQRSITIEEVLANIAESTKRPVVSVTTSDNLMLQQYNKGEVRSNLDSLAMHMNAKWSLEDETFLIYKLIPQWFVSSANHERPDNSAEYRLIEMLSTEQLMAFAEKDNLPIRSLTLQQQETIAKHFQSYVGELVNGVIKQDQDLDWRITDALLSIELHPAIFVYHHREPVGTVEFHSMKEKLEFKAVKVKEANEIPASAAPASAALTKTIKLIKPAVELSAGEAKLPIRIERSSIMEVKDLLTAVEKQTGVSIRADRRLLSQTIFISKQEWRLDELMRAVTSVLGYELRKLKDIYWLAPSRAHLSVAQRLTMEQELVELPQRFLLQLLPILQGKHFTDKIDPFDQRLFAQTSLIPVDKLPLQQRAFLLNLIGDDVNPAELKAWFFVGLSVSIRPDLDFKIQGTMPPPMVGSYTYLSGVSPKQSLPTEVTQGWTQEMVDELRQKYQADIIFE